MTKRHLFVLCAVMSTLCTFPAFANSEGFTDSFSYISTKRWYVSNGWTNGGHQSCEWRARALSIDDDGLLMTLSDNGGKVRPIGCPELRTKERLGYGRYEARIRTAAGEGLNTAFFSYIGPPMGIPEHDEIDFEFLGKNPSKVEINHVVKGKIIKGKIVDLGFDSSKDFHDYAFDWSPTSIVWFVDGKEVYRTPLESPLPRNPGHMFFSLWSGSEVEDSWMGHFDYKAPVSAQVAWARFSPHQ